MADLSVEIAGIRFKNPVIAASGTYGFGKEFSQFLDLNRLGGIAAKGLTHERREGNKPPRIAETPAGILNSIGLQNPGIERFIKEELPFLDNYDTVVIANIAGNTVDEYGLLAEKISETTVDAIEINVSCPNVKEGCAVFGSTARGVAEVTGNVKKRTKKPVFVKLTPNVTDIREIAIAAEEAGADAVTLINTLLGMAIDVETRRPILANNFGGLSGPAVKPIALRMVYETACAVKIPVIGMGGISCGKDAIEFLLAGASAVMVGTANFVSPTACIDIINGIEHYLAMKGERSVADIIGKLELNK